MPSHTHAIEMTATEVRKRYRSWDRGEPDREWACLTLLQAHAPGLAPRPLRRETSADAPVVVMERLSGMPLGGGPMTHEQTALLGEALRRLYDVPLAAAEGAGIQERVHGPSSLAGVLNDWLARDYDLSRCQRPRLVDRVVSLANEWLTHNDLPAPKISVLGIADLNPANIIWDGQRCRLIDFEDAGLSDPAYELADHVEHLGGRLHAVYDVESLIDAVGLTLQERNRMERYRSLWAVFWLLMLLPGNRGFDRNPAGTTEQQAEHLLQLIGS